MRRPSINTSHWRAGRRTLLCVLLAVGLMTTLSGCEIPQQIFGVELPIKLCGDGYCDEHLGEDHDWCSRDCRCGNGNCDANEDPTNCPADCSCGDERCQAAFGEDHATCPADCPVACGNGECEADLGETPWSCEIDCGSPCGNGRCEPEYGEFQSTCPADCRADMRR